MISPEKTSLDSLPSTPYSDRHKLPTLKAVYLVAQDKKVIYVGATVNLNRRLRSHCKKAYFEGCDVFYIVINDKGFLYGLKSMERAFIRHYKPFLNTQHSAHPYVEPIPEPNSKLLYREEVAEILNISVSTLKVRGGDTECLLEIRQTKKVQFNPKQIAAHRENVWAYGKCGGRCQSALQPQAKEGGLRMVKQRAG